MMMFHFTSGKRNFKPFVSNVGVDHVDAVISGDGQQPDGHERCGNDTETGN